MSWRYGCGVLVVAALLLVNAISFEVLAGADDEQGEAEGTEVMVRVLGLRSARGAMAFALYRSAADYEIRENAAHTAYLPLQDKSSTWVIPDLGPGEYALLVYHDVNGNRRLDRRKPFGIPKEPYGCSNDASAPFGPPTFEQTRFTVGVEPMTIQVRLR